MVVMMTTSRSWDIPPSVEQAPANQHPQPAVWRAKPALRRDDDPHRTRRGADQYGGGGGARARIRPPASRHAMRPGRGKRALEARRARRPPGGCDWAGETTLQNGDRLEAGRGGWEGEL